MFLFVIAPVFVSILLLSNDTPPELTLSIVNQSEHSIEGRVSFLDQWVAVTPLTPKEQAKLRIPIRELRKQSRLQDQVGKLIFHYTLDNSQENKFEIFGYIEPADTYLYGKTGHLTFDQQGRPSITFDAETP